MYSIPQEIKLVLKRLNDSGNEAYIVGGAVRNMLLNIKVNDYDITTSAHPNTVKQLFSEYNQYIAGKKYGTVVILIGDFKIDITTFRQDLDYIDHRHPKSVEFTTSLKEDLKRRDFTINAMCIDINANLIDYFGGVDDLNNKIIKAIGNPNTRFNEDALRILRGIKFASRLNFDIESETKKAIFNDAYLLKKIAKERIKEEFMQILSYPNKQKYINEYLNVFNTFVPIKETDKRINNFLDSYYSLAYLLSYTEGYNLKDLKYSKNEINLLKELINSTSLDINNDYQLITSFSSIYGKEVCTYLSQLYDNDLSKKFNKFKSYIVDINSLNISGEELMRYGYKGEEIKKIKNKLIDEIRLQHFKNDNTAIKKYLESTGI